MRFTVVTILPELIEPSLTAGVVGRAREAGTITVDTVNPRDFTHDRHRTVDDNPYGGGPGMVMKAEPMLAAIARASGGGTSASTTATTPSAGVVEDPEDITTTLRFARPSSTGAAPSASTTIAPDDITTTRPFTRPPKSPAAAAIESSIANVESSIDKLEHALDGNLDALVAQDALEGSSIEPSPASPTGAPPTGAPPSGTTPTGTTPTAASGTTATGTTASGTTATGTTATGTTPTGTTPTGTTPTGTSASGATSSGATSSGTASSGTSETGTGASATGGSSVVSGAGAEAARAHRILLSPSGTPLTQARVRELAKLPHLVLVCGRYEGIDQRVIDAAIDEEISIGDFVLSGGELGALVIIDAVARYVPGVLGAADSVDEESFSAGLLEYPHYTRPPELATSHLPASLPAGTTEIQRTIPPVLQSGNHAAIAAWRRQRSIERTATRRPDLFRAFRPTKADIKALTPLHARTHLALVHHPVVDRVGTVITTALTNFDIHDLARSTMTFGLAGYHIVTPITSQRDKAEHIAKLWMADEQGEHRAAALRLVRVAESVDQVIAAITADHGAAPLVVATSAKSTSFPAALRRTTTELLAEMSAQPTPVLLLLGTGWGLADSLIPSVSRVLAPIEGGSDWNHLSVRSAGAIILDRLFGRPA